MLSNWNLMKLTDSGLSLYFIINHLMTMIKHFFVLLVFASSDSSCLLFSF